jgi:hypothetical protein
VRDEIVASIDAHARGRTADTRTPNTLVGQALVKLKRFGAAHIKAATWARIFDGGKDGGPVWEYLIRSANEAGDSETRRARRRRKSSPTWSRRCWRPGRSTTARGALFPSIGRSLNREARLAIALNWGNESNRQRLLGGEGWSAAQVSRCSRA